MSPKTQPPVRIGSADLETYVREKDQTHQTFKIALYENPHLHLFSGAHNKTLPIPAFINYLYHLPYGGNIYIYFHNFANFDGFPIAQYLKKASFSHQAIIREHRIYELFFQNFSGTRIHLRDSFLHIRFSLKEATLLFKVKHPKSEFDFKKLQLSSLKEDEASLEAYLIQDVLALHDILEKYQAFLKKHFQRNIYDSLTLATLSQQIYLTHYYPAPFQSLKAPMDQFIRPSYLGGIVDIYQPYLQEGVLLDVNGLYPYVMKKYKFGLGSLYFLSPDRLAEAQAEPLAFCKKELGFIRVKVRCNKLYHPVLAIKHQQKNIQPGGEFTATLYSEEIRYCLEQHPGAYRFHFLQALIYPSSDYIFKDFVEELYEKRQCFQAKGQSGEAKIIKSMMNSLYGRFGLKVEEERSVFLQDEEEILKYLQQEDRITQVSTVGDSYLISSITSPENLNLFLKKFKSRIDYASAITALARLHMQTLKEAYPISYTDTDSLALPQSLLPLLRARQTIGKQLGQLKIEALFEEGLFISPKIYLLKEKNNYVIKGLNLPDGRKKEALYEHFKEYLTSSPPSGFYSSPRFTIRKDLKQGELHHRGQAQLHYRLNFDKRRKITQKECWVDTSPPYVTLLQTNPNSIIK